MTLAELNTTLESTGLPVRYRAFAASERPIMPFIVYQETGSNNTGADNIVWFSARRIQIDLLTKLRDLETETNLETTLTNARIYWEREVVFDDDEAYYRVTYTCEI